MSRLVTRKELREALGIPYSIQHLTRLEAAGLFPRRLKLQAFRGGRVVWVEAEVRAWIEARLKQRDAAP